MDKQRFILAIILSAAILFAWSLLVKRPQPQPQQSNANSNSAVAEQKQGGPAATPSETTASGQEKPATGPTPEVSAETNDLRTIEVKTPLYTVKLDNRGAVATSWILEKNKDSGNPLHSVGGTKDKPKPLELISQERMSHEPREAPLRLQTVDG